MPGASRNENSPSTRSVLTSRRIYDTLSGWNREPLGHKRLLSTVFYQSMPAPETNEHFGEIDGRLDSRILRPDERNPAEGLFSYPCFCFNASASLLGSRSLTSEMLIFSFSGGGW